MGGWSKRKKINQALFFFPIVIFVVGWGVCAIITQIAISALDIHNETAVYVLSLIISALIMYVLASTISGYVGSRLAGPRIYSD